MLLQGTFCASVCCLLCFCSLVTCAHFVCSDNLHHMACFSHNTCSTRVLQMSKVASVKAAVRSASDKTTQNSCCVCRAHKASCPAAAGSVWVAAHDCACCGFPCSPCNLGPGPHTRQVCFRCYSQSALHCSRHFSGCTTPHTCYSICLDSVWHAIAWASWLRVYSCVQLFDWHSCDTYSTCVSVRRLAGNATYGMPWCGSNGMQCTMVCCTIK